MPHLDQVAAAAPQAVRSGTSLRLMARPTAPSEELRELERVDNVQSIDVHTMLGQLVGAVQSHSAESEKQAAHLCFSSVAPPLNSSYPSCRHVLKHHSLSGPPYPLYPRIPLNSGTQIEELTTQNEEQNAQNEKQNGQIEKQNAQNEEQNQQIEKQNQQIADLQRNNGLLAEQMRFLMNQTQALFAKVPF